MLDELFNQLLHVEDDALRAAREAGSNAGMPPIDVSAQHGKLLQLLAIITRARRILEIGTLAGYSTINLARGVAPGGHVVTLEYEPKHAAVARANLTQAGLDDRVEVIVGPALDALPKLLERGERFDLVFIDADKENNPAYIEWGIKLSSPGTVIVIDNVARNGLVLEPPADDPNARGTRDALEMMGKNPRLDTAAIQTVGAKGWDGFALAVVR